MVKSLIVQEFARIPNEYVNVEIERNRALSITEERLLFMLINRMQKRYESKKKTDYLDYRNIDFDWVISGEIHADEFRKTMNIGEKNNRLLKAALVKLASYVIFFDWYGETNIFSILSEFTFISETGIIKYKFKDRFAELMLFTKSNFFKLSIPEVIGFTSSHALKMYQLLKSKLNMERKEHTYSIESLKQYLNIQKKYSLYGDFKRHVLNVVKEQINSSGACDFFLNTREVKIGSKVVGITFILRNKAKQNYYEQKNIMPPFKMKEIKEKLPQWLNSKNTIIKEMAQKINGLKADKSRAAIQAYYNVITEQIAQANQ